MAPSDPRQTKFVLDELRIPRAWYNIAADLPVPPLPPLHPGTGQPIGPDDLAPLVPDGAHRPGGLRRARDRDPRPRPRRLPPLPAEPALPGPSARARPRYAGPHLLQVRGRQSGRQPQAEHGNPAGVVQPAGRRQAPCHRDRRGTVGECPCVRGGVVRPRGQGLHGARELRPEAVPADPHGDVRRRGRREPVADHELRAQGPRRDPGQSGLPRDRDQRSRRGCRDARRHQVLPGIRAQSRAVAPDRDRPGGHRTDGHGRRIAGHHHRLHRRRIELRGADVPVPRAQLPRGGDAPGHRRRARGRAEPDARRVCLRLRRHREADAAREDAHARLRLRPGADPRRRAALPRHGAAGQPAQGARLHRGAQRPPALQLRSRRHLRPSRRHPARARAEPRHPGRDRRGTAAKEAGEARVILFNLCGHGHFDLSAYERYLDGTLEDYEYPAEKVEAALAALPGVG